MAKSIFKVLRNLEDDLIIKNGQDYSDTSKSVLYDLISFIEEGCFLKSEAERFLCSNWRLNSDELVDLCAKNHKVGEPNRNSNTIRSQLSLLNSLLVSLLKLNSEELDSFFRTNNEEELKRLVILMDAIRSSDKLPKSNFSGLCAYMDALISSQTYDFNDCKKEFALLKTLENSNIRRLFDSVDLDKLAYLFSLVSKPVFEIVYEDGVTKEGTTKKRKERYVEYNEDKIAFLQAYGVTKTIELPSSDATINIDVSAIKPIHFDNTVETYKRHFKLNFTEKTDAKLHKFMCSVSSKPKEILLKTLEGHSSDESAELDSALERFKGGSCSETVITDAMRGKAGYYQFNFLEPYWLGADS